MDRHAPEVCGADFPSARIFSEWPNMFKKWPFRLFTFLRVSRRMSWKRKSFARGAHGGGNGELGMVQIRATDGSMDDKADAASSRVESGKMPLPQQFR